MRVKNLSWYAGSIHLVSIPFLTRAKGLVNAFTAVVSNRAGDGVFFVR